MSVFVYDVVIKLDVCGMWEIIVNVLGFLFDVCMFEYEVVLMLILEILVLFYVLLLFLFELCL